MMTDPRQSGASASASAGPGRADFSHLSISDENITHEQYRAHQHRRRDEIRRNTLALLALIRQARAAGPVLDLGVGTGVGLRCLAEGLPAGTPIHAVDRDERMLAYARDELSGLDNVTLWLADAQKRLPFADATFGLVHSEYTLHHLRDPGAAVREVGRVLKKGGLFVLIDIDPHNWMSRLFAFGYPMARAVGLGWPSGEAACCSIVQAPPFFSLHELLRGEGFEIAYRVRKRIRQVVAAIKTRLPDH